MSRVEITPELVTAVSSLIGALASAGFDIASMLREARKNGKVPEEQWKAIMAGIRKADDLWESAPAPAPAPVASVGGGDIPSIPTT